MTSVLRCDKNMPTLVHTMASKDAAKYNKTREGKAALRDY